MNTDTESPEDCAETEYLRRRLINLQGDFSVWGASLVKAYGSVAKYGFLPPVSVNRRSKWIVMGTRIFNILDDDMRKQSHLVMSARDILRCKSIPRSFTYDLKIYKTLHRLMTNENMNSSRICEERVEKILAETHAEVLVSNSTLDPINRIWLKVAKKLGIRTVCVQHGVYSDLVPEYEPEEDIVDSYVALDTSQVPILTRYIPLHKIHPQGVRDSFMWRPPCNSLKICFVGEDWERYGAKGIELKKQIVECYIDLIEDLRRSGHSKFYYKPHPSECNLYDMDSAAFLIKNKDLDIPDVFIGFSSTLLKEMSSRRKLTIQIKEDKTHALDFELMGYCLSLEYSKTHEFFSAIKNILNREIKVPCITNAGLANVIKGLSHGG